MLIPKLGGKYFINVYKDSAFKAPIRQGNNDMSKSYYPENYMGRASSQVS